MSNAVLGRNQGVDAEVVRLSRELLLARLLVLAGLSGMMLVWMNPRLMSL